MIVNAAPDRILRMGCWSARRPSTSGCWSSTACPNGANRCPPLDELVSTILSQNTNDRNRDLAFTACARALPTWEAVRDADPRGGD